MDVVARQGERVKAVDSGYEEGKYWKTRERVRGRQWLCLRLVVFIS